MQDRLIFLHAGYSHGKALSFILEGIPAGLDINIDFINEELKRRKNPIGRSDRAKTEPDQIEILSGIINDKTTGSAIWGIIKNKYQGQLEPVYIPRPGHADLAGMLKFGFDNARYVIEAASARETATRVAAGAICKLLLKEFKVDIFSWTVKIGNIEVSDNLTKEFYNQLKEKLKDSKINCPDKEKEQKMIELIQEIQERGDTLGGIVEVIAKGVVFGLGSYTQWSQRLDAKISAAMMSIPSVKGVEIGLGFRGTNLFGSQYHDQIFYEKNKGYYRMTNNAGGIEGGITNSEDIIIRLAVKPIATLKKPLSSVDIRTKEQTKAHYERSDVCVVMQVGVIGEAMLAFVLANEYLRKFGGDNICDMKNNYQEYLKSRSLSEN